MNVATAITWNPDASSVVPKMPEIEAAAMSRDSAPCLAALAAGLAHEVNNPLAYVLTNLDFVREHVAEYGDDDLLAALDEARLGALRIGAVVRGLQMIATGELAVEDQLELNLGEVARPARELATRRPRSR